MKRILHILLFAFIVNNGLSAQLSIHDGASNYTIDFDQSFAGVNEASFSGSGLNIPPGPGQLHGGAWGISGMSDGAHTFGQINISGDFARGSSNGGVSTGGLYAFDVGSGNQTIGIQPTGSDWTPGAICLKINNNQTTTINTLEVDYTVYILNDQDRSNSMNFSYSLDNINYTTISGVSIISNETADGSPSWVSNPKSLILANLGLTVGGSLYLKWSGNDISGSGSRDEFAIDDINITVSGVTGNCEEPSAQATNFSFTTVTDNSIQGTYDAVLADKYLLLQSTSSTLNENPVDGTTYSPGAQLGNAEVIQYNNTTSFSSIGLIASTTYYYYVFSANDDCTGGPEYLISNPLSGTTSTTADPNENYYHVVNGETCAVLKTVLHNLIKGHLEYNYSDLWTIYQTTDDHLNDAGTETIVWDMYSDNPTGSENEFTFVSEQCGTYSTEGDCYNREHTFPKSWWGGATNVAQYTDIFAVIPVDGWINGVRNNNPYGEVQTGAETQITNNGSSLGPSAINIPGYGGNVFEPIDEYKGDLARNYFYMITRYEDEIASWENNTVESDAVLDGNTFPGMEQWSIDMLLDWHTNDPVSQKEIDRNDDVYAYQLNRNPFIDHPEYAALIWENCSGTDTEAPTVPASLAASNITQTSTDLSWIASADNVGVTAYNVYQDGNVVLTTNGSTTSVNISSLMASTTYVFVVTALDAAGNESPASNTANVTTQDPPGGPMVLHEGYFETGWDNWTDGGSDASRYSGSRSPEGTYSIKLRDNSGTSSSMTSETFDLSSFNSVEVQFSFRSFSFENNENFWLRYYDGSTWQTIANYVRGTDFENNTNYNSTVILSSSNYNLASNAQFRFQSDASANNDHVYIDAVVITGTQGGGAAQDITGIQTWFTSNTNIGKESFHQNTRYSNEITSEARRHNTNKVDVFPNPVSANISINIHASTEVKSLSIYNLLGQLILYRFGPATSTSEFDVSQFDPGIYTIQILYNNGLSATQKFVKE